MINVPGKIELKEGNAIFELTGVDRILAIKSRLVVPLHHISSVTTEKADWRYFNELKVAGARLPNVVKDGGFWSPKDGLLFYEMHDPNSCVTVELFEERYKKIIFQVDDKEATATQLRKAAQATNKH